MMSGQRLPPRSLLLYVSILAACGVRCGAHAVHKTRREDDGVARLSGSRRLHGFVAADLKELSDPVPQVRHYKVPKEGYTRHSPLFARQEMWSDAKKPTTPRPSTTSRSEGSFGTSSEEELVAKDEEVAQDVVTPEEEAAQARLEEAVKISPEPAPPTPTISTDFVPPVSVTVRCITNLTCQFFVVYTILVMLQIGSKMGLATWQREEKRFSAVVETVHFVPMLCVLFMATRMRAVQLTRARPERYDLPQWWVKVAMQVCTWSMLLLTVAVFFLSRVSPEIAADAMGKKPPVPAGAVALKYVGDAIMAVVYLSCAVVCVGAGSMQVPSQLAGDPPHESAALACTICLTILFFAVHLARASATFANRAGLLGEAMRFGNAQEMLRSATTTVAFAPMLTVLFIAARVRTLQEDGGVFEGHQLAGWVQACFYISTFSVFLHTFFVAAFFACVPDERNTGLEIQANGPGARWKAVSRALEMAQLACMVLLTLSVLTVTFGAVLLPRSAPASVELDCVVALSMMYFGVYLVQWAVRRTRQGRVVVSAADECLHAAKVQVQFCPMFCVLFLACLLRALQVTGGRGAPPAWCQVVECVATGAIVCLVLLCLEKLPRQRAPGAARACEIFRYFCIGLFYGSAAACVYALYAMTPESAAPVPGRLEPVAVVLFGGARGGGTIGR